MRCLRQYGLLLTAAGILLCGEASLPAQNTASSSSTSHALSPAEAGLAAARRCSDSTCTFSALTSALRVDPGNVDALVALSDYYVSRNQSLKARSLLEQAIAHAPRDANASLKLADLDSADGLNSRALAQYRKLEQEFPSDFRLQGELAARYEKLGMVDHALELARAAQSHNPDDENLRALLLRIYERRHDAAALRQLYQDEHQNHPAEPAPLVALAKLDAGAGHWQAAESELRQAVALAPNDSEAQSQLADLLEQSGDSAGAKAILSEAIRSKPGDDNLHQRLAALGTRSADPDAAYVVDAARIAAEALRHPPEGDATILADVRVQHVAENGLSTLRSQQLVYVGSEQKAREYTTRSVLYAPDAQQLHILAARIYQPNGQILEAENGGETSVADAGVSMYYDGRSRTLNFAALRKGDVLELDYRVTPTSAENPYGTYFGDLVAFRANLPQKLQRYVLVVPASRRFNILEHGLATAAVASTASERTYRWETRDTPTRLEEPRSPALTEVAPYVSVSSFANWQELGRWYAELIAPQFELDDALRSALDQILAGKDSQRDKINAIHQFVLQNTHYVALEFGVYGYKPYPVSQTFARRFGDCKDKASLMVALLRAAGIPADLALVRTRRLGDIGEQATSISIFNHAIVYVPSEDLWLDGTAEYAGPRELPLEDQGAMALTVARDGAAELRRIPRSEALDNYTHRTLEATIAPSGAISFSGSAYTRGEDAPGLRREYALPEHQQQAFRDHLAELFPAVHVDAVQVEGASDIERDIALQFRGELNSFRGRLSLTLPTTWLPRPYVETLAPLASRSEALLLPAPWTTEESLRFSLPRGARIESLPRDTVLETPFGVAKFHYALSHDELAISSSVQFRKLRIEPNEYPDFRDFCARIEGAFRNSVKVVLAR